MAECYDKKILYSTFFNNKYNAMDSYSHKKLLENIEKGDIKTKKIKKETYIDEISWRAYAHSIIEKTLINPLYREQYDKILNNMLNLTVENKVLKRADNLKFVGSIKAPDPSIYTDKNCIAIFDMADKIKIRRKNDKTLTKFFSNVSEPGKATYFLEGEKPYYYADIPSPINKRIGSHFFSFTKYIFTYKPHPSFLNISLGIIKDEEKSEIIKQLKTLILLNELTFKELAHKKTVKSHPVQELIPKKYWMVNKSEINSNEKVLNHPVFNQAFQDILDNWTPKSNVAFMSLCTKTRPYSESQKYKKYIERFGEYVDFIVTSNAGLIPRDYWEHQLFLTYNGPVENKKHDELYKSVLSDRLNRFFEKFEYEYVIVNFSYKKPRVQQPMIMVLSEMKKNGKIKDFAIIPDKELYEKAQDDGFKGGMNGAGDMFPDLHLFILSELEMQVRYWSNHIQTQL